MTKLRVYVSSTYEDLKDFRAKVIEGLRRGGYELVTMEDYPAFDQRPLAKCLADVASCQIYVGILAKRYGHVPTKDNPDKRSITEREYLQATQSRLPRLVFQLDPETPWLDKFNDRLAKGRDRGKNIERFRAHVGKEHGNRYFSGPDELAKLVLEAISAWEKEHPATLPGSPSTPPPSAPAFRWPSAGDFAALIAAKREGFSGREWLFAEVDAWAADSASRALLIRADYGVGKSAFLAELVARNPGGAVVAWHFCQHDTRQTLRRGAFVRNLAGQLRDSLPAYREAVEARPELQERLDRALEDPGSAFEAALLNPLATLSAPPAPRLILIDALDEALEVDREEAQRVGNLVALLANKASRLPPWLRLVVTARNNPEVISRLQGAFTLTQIDAEGADNRDDLYAYAHRQACQDPIAAQLAAVGKSADWLAGLLRDRAGGKFLYVARALRDLKEKRLTLAQAGELPPGMDGFYLDAFERRFDKAGRAYGPFRALLGLLCALREPVSAGPLAELLGCETRHIQAAHALLPDFIVRRQGGYTFEHFSIAEWLSRESDEGFPRAGPYAVNLASAEACIHHRALQRIRDGNAHQFDYLVRHLAHHLPDAAERRGAFTTLMQDYRWLHERLRLAGVDALLGDCRHLGDSEFGRLLAACLRNSAHVLRRNPEQLAAQVLGRLGERNAVVQDITRLCASVREAVRRAVSSGELANTLLPVTASVRLDLALSAVLEVQGVGVAALAVLPDGRLASGCDDGTIQLWALQGSAEPLVLKGHKKLVNDLAVLPDGRLASGSNDGTIRLWNCHGRAEPQVLYGHANQVTALEVLPDGQLASGCDDGTIQLWALQGGAEPLVLKGHDRWVTALVVLPDGRLASGSSDRRICLWDIQGEAKPQVLEGHGGWVRALAVLPDGRLASGSHDGTIRLWDLQDGAEPQVLEGHGGWVRALAVLPDGRLACGSNDGTIRLWDLRGGAELQVLEGHGDWVTALAVLPDGRLASGSADGAIRLWDLQGGAEPQVLGEHEFWVAALAVLPDGRLASGSEDTTIRLWDLQGGAEPQVLEGHGGGVRALAVLPDGRLVAAAGARVLVWQAAFQRVDAWCEADAVVTCLEAPPSGGVVAGDASGRLHFLELIERRP